MYYGIAGNNGFGVYDDYNRMQKNRDFLSKPISKKFDSFYGAFEWAKAVYNDGQEVDDAFYGVSTDIRMNWLMFRKDIRQNNIKE